MSDIKTKPKTTIKQIDKGFVNLQKTKDNLVTTKEKIDGATINDENNSGEEYASKKLQNNISYLSRNGILKGNEIGKKSVIETKENYAKVKTKINKFKAKMEEKKASELKKSIKSGTKRTIKNARTTAKLTSKGIKTKEIVAKESSALVKSNIKASQKLFQISNAVVKQTSNAVKGTIKVIKSALSIAKGVISTIIAGGWIAILVILIIVIIAGFVASVFNSNGNTDYDSSQIPNSEIVLVAKAQIGNEGGEKFWKWYGFNERVEWCACYVSWCANECGYIDKGIIPKFAACTNGIDWFKEHNEWQDRSESYYPMVGDIIFFDWKDDSGNQDGTADHVGIVTRTDIANRTIYTIEGNTSDKCAERMYSFDDTQVMGYGTPKYE